MATKVKTSKIWNYTYTFQIRFIGMMSKTQFIADISELTCDNKNWIKERISETTLLEDIATAKAKPNQAIKIMS